MNSVDDFIEKAMQLSDKERVEIARRLLLSLEHVSDELSDEQWIAAWRPELERRVRAYERGETSAIDWRESLARVRNALDEPRS